MTKESSFDLFDMYKKMSIDFEKNMNEMIHNWSENEASMEFYRFLSEANLKQPDTLYKFQKKWLGELNLPSKMDLENIVRIALQTEEKIDACEEQYWEFSDVMRSVNEEIKGLVESTKQLTKENKLLKNEVAKLKTDLKVKNETKELEALKHEVAEIKDLLIAKDSILENEGFRQEIKEMKEILGILKEKHEKEIPIGT